jgi:hypothetical protein
MTKKELFYKQLSNMKTFSKNKKLNDVLNEIYDDLLSIHDTEKESIDEIKHYVSEFKNETDYNLYQYGKMIVYNGGIRDLYSDYKSLKNASMEKLIGIYKRQIRYVVNYILTK